MSHEIQQLHFSRSKVGLKKKNRIRGKKLKQGPEICCQQPPLFLHLILPLLASSSFGWSRLDGEVEILRERRAPNEPE